ncbi:prostamide:prostaglandin F synthase [Echinococcus multilocularis]|uniref:Prostamide:prostaglandin F synthase n=1 Tax=Echinococcus multilocularis TaxID=6211 RepID=A0A068YFQ3_ECHMU|nr:prostamide:prostaglandin F synthase [Echinococcus multilocularis]
MTITNYFSLLRFGCAFCRLHALELSRFQSAFQAKRVRLIGIGHDNEGVEEFREEQFFSGELYLDERKETYASLDCESVGLVSGMFSLVQSAGGNLIRETKAFGKNVVGNLKGDGWQTGGLVVVDKGISYRKRTHEFPQACIVDNIHRPTATR